MCRSLALAATTVAVVACNGLRTDWGSGQTCTYFETEIRNSYDAQIDVLFVIDNSPSMGDKSALLATSLPDLVNRLVNPDCVDVNGNVLGPSSGGKCASGWPANRPANDLHVAIVSSSLGASGGDLCGSHGLGAREDDRAELLNRVGDDEHSVADAQPSNFLAWFPGVLANRALPSPPVPALADATRLVADFADLVGGVHTTGCAFEACLESAYRSLVQPDPHDHVDVVNGRALLSGVDGIVLAQRHDFLRPDSLLAVVVVTDENDASIDPLAMGGQAWGFGSRAYPGSPAGAAPRATVECVDPNDARCTSCPLIANDPSFSSRCPGGAYLDPSQDPPALRFFQMKRRFGVDALFPLSRYVRGLSMPAVPDRDHEHDSTGAYAVDPSSANCVNPIFARDLPTDPSQDLCRLSRGPRTSDLVYFGVVAGVPHQLLQLDRSNADSPQKDVLSEADWQLIIGKDPEHYDFTGSDFHMIESDLPRTGQNLPPGVVNAATCLPGGSDTCDPFNGREWDTRSAALELACTFPLAVPNPSCTQAELAPGCDCGTGGDMPVCDAQTGIQSRGKAYPSVRELGVARALGPQGIVGSICPSHVTESAPGDPLFGFRDIGRVFLDRLRGGGESWCFPPFPIPDSAGRVPCTVFATLPGPGDESLCEAYGFDVPEADVLRRFRARQHDAWRAGGGADAGVPDPVDVPTCIVPQLFGADLDASGSCSSASKLGWCYATGAAAGSCPQTLLFSPAGSFDGAYNHILLTMECAPGC